MDRSHREDCLESLDAEPRLVMLDELQRRFAGKDQNASARSVDSGVAGAISWRTDRRARAVL